MAMVFSLWSSVEESANFLGCSSARAFFSEFLPDLTELLPHFLLQLRALEEHPGFVRDRFGVGVLLDELGNDFIVGEQVHESEVGNFDEVLAEEIGRPACFVKKEEWRSDERGLKRGGPGSDEREIHGFHELIKGNCRALHGEGKIPQQLIVGSGAHIWRS